MQTSPVRRFRPWLPLILILLLPAAFPVPAGAGSAPHAPRPAAMRVIYPGGVGVYNQPSASGRRVANLASGSRVQVLAVTNNFVRVGSRVGRWVMVEAGSKLGWSFDAGLEGEVAKGRSTIYWHGSGAAINSEYGYLRPDPSSPGRWSCADNCRILNIQYAHDGLVLHLRSGGGGAYGPYGGGNGPYGGGGGGGTERVCRVPNETLRFADETAREAEAVCSADNFS